LISVTALAADGADLASFANRSPLVDVCRHSSVGLSRFRGSEIAVATTPWVRGTMIAADIVPRAMQTEGRWRTY